MKAGELGIFQGDNLSKELDIRVSLGTFWGAAHSCTTPATCVRVIRSILEFELTYA